MALARVNIPSMGGVSIIPINVPSQSGTITYNGTEQSPIWTDYDPAQILIGGTTAATDAGTYIATFTPQGLFTWKNGTQDTKQVTWAINKAALNLSANIDGAVAYGSTGTITVNGNVGGSTITATSDNTNSVTVQSATTDSVTVLCAGYSAAGATVTLTVPESTNYLAGETTCAVSTKKADCALSLSESSGTVGLNGTITFTVTTPSDGTLSVSSSKTSVATATISGNTVTITGKSAGNAIITVYQTAGKNYNAPTAVTYSATVQIVVGNTLNETDWGTISDVSKAGIGDTHWNIGDCKEVTLNGSIGTLSLSNQTLCVFILHFNYAMNGTADNNIIWGGFKSALTNGRDYALCDNKYNTYPIGDTKCFNMNHWCNLNFGGWKGCDLRYDILGATSTQPSDYGKAHTTSCVGYDATAATLTSPKADTLLAALPSDFRNALRLWTRWVDAVGNKSNVEANIKSTVDAVTFLTEFKVQGVRSHANEYEQNHQTQMDYYKNGNSKAKYKHSSSSSEARWWCASPVSGDAGYFCAVTYNGVASSNAANGSYGVAPAFKT